MLKDTLLYYTTLPCVRLSGFPQKQLMGMQVIAVKYHLLFLGLWQSVHIDDLRTSKDMISDITSLRNITISQLFSENTGESAENPESKKFNYMFM